MIPAAFEYTRARSLDEAIDLIAADEEAKLLAGGHSLLPMMRLRLVRPSRLVDLGGLRGELAYIRPDLEGGEIAVGAMTRHHDLAADSVLRSRLPLLAAAAAIVGDPQVRHRGTLGGTLAHADPAADLPAVCLALDARLLVRGPTGERSIAAEDFFTGFFESALASNEVLVEVRFPALPEGHGWSYQKFNRRAQDWATVAVAAVVEHEAGTITRAAVGLVGMGDRPLRARAVEAALANPTTVTLTDAAGSADDDCSPTSDLAASADFRRHLARVLTRRALEEAVGRHR